jgi:hypothetical protein
MERRELGDNQGRIGPRRKGQELVHAFGKMLVLDHDHQTPHLLSTFDLSSVVICLEYGGQLPHWEYALQRHVCRSAWRSYTSSADTVFPCLSVELATVGTAFRIMALGKIADLLKKGRMLNEMKMLVLGYSVRGRRPRRRRSITTQYSNPPLHVEESCIQTHRILSCRI